MCFAGLARGLGHGGRYQIRFVENLDQISCPEHGTEDEEENVRPFDAVPPVDKEVATLRPLFLGRLLVDAMIVHEASMRAPSVAQIRVRGRDGVRHVDEIRIDYVRASGVHSRAARRCFRQNRAAVVELPVCNRDRAVLTRSAAGL